MSQFVKRKHAFTSANFSASPDVIKKYTVPFLRDLNGYKYIGVEKIRKFLQDHPYPASL